MLPLFIVYWHCLSLIKKNIDIIFMLTIRNPEIVLQGATIGSCFEGFLDEEEIDGVPCSYCGNICESLL